MCNMDFFFSNTLVKEFTDVLDFLNKADVVILLIYLPKELYNLEETAFQVKKHVGTAVCRVLWWYYNLDIY